MLAVATTIVILKLFMLSLSAPAVSAAVSNAPELPPSVEVTPPAGMC